MIELNTEINEFVGGNWLAIAVFLVALKSLATQTGWRFLQILYRTLNKCFEVVRPASDIAVSSKKPPKKKVEKK